MKFSPDELRELVKEAIFAKMTPEGREQLIKESLEKLLKTAGLETARSSNFNQRSGSYDNVPSPLEQAFTSAARDVAREVVTEVLNTEEYRSRIKAVCVEAVEAMFAKRTAKLSETVGDRLAELLFPWDR